MTGSRRVQRAVAAILASVFIVSASLLAGCSDTQATTFSLTGHVIDDTAALPAPVILTPAPDIEAGFETTGAPTLPTGSSAGNGLASGASQTTSWVKVASVRAGLGDAVKQGDLIAQVETASLDAAVAAAQADEKYAQSTVKLIDDRAGTLNTNASDVASKTAELTKTVTDLTRQRADLQVKLAAAEAAAGSLTETSTIPPGQTDPRVLVLTLKASILKIDEALTKANQGLVDLATATTDINTARTAIQATRDAAAAVAAAYGVATRIAQAQRDQAQVLAPFDGTIVQVARPGEVLAGGAPVAVLRPASASTITTYVTDEGRLPLSVGMQAGVLIDSQPSRGYTGHISALGNEYEYVPTWFATKVIHLTRGFRVEIELDQGQTLPAGTPVDVSISVK